MHCARILKRSSGCRDFHVCDDDLRTMGSEDLANRPADPPRAASHNGSFPSGNFTSSASQYPGCTLRLDLETHPTADERTDRKAYASHKIRNS